MRNLKFMMPVAVVLLSGACAFSQSKTEQSATPTKTNHSEAPKFSSVYTDLKQDCAYEDADNDSGSDPSFVCKPVGDYRIVIYFSAMASHISVRSLNDKYSETFAAQSLNYNDAPGRKIEWRLADGKPFAVIARIYKYGDKVGDTGQDTYADSNKTGEVLHVKGLKGYERIDSEVDVKTTPNPNEKAREIADSNYQKK